MAQTLQNWHKVKLGDVAEVLPGFAFKSSQFKKNSGISVIKIKNITDGFGVSLDGEYLDETALNEKTKKFLLGFGDILIAMTGATAGKVGKFRSREKALLNQRVAKVSPKQIDPDYLWALLGNKDTVRALYRLADGAAQPNMSGGQIENLEFTIPKRIDEQGSIAEKIVAYDNLIENNTRRIQILEEMAQAVYTEWFVSFHFPGHENVETVDSGTDLGIIPQGWTVKKLGEKISISRGRSITKETVTEGNVPVVAGGLEPAYYHNTANTEAPVVTVSASGANAGFVNLYMENVWASDCSYIDKKVTPFVFYYFLLLKSRQVEVTSLQRGSAQPHVYPKDLLELLVVDVPDNLLRSFENIVGIIFGFVGNLKKQNKILRDSRNLLLPKLVTGEIKV